MTNPRRVLRHYEVGAEIGAGGMGRLFAGTDLRDESPVAIKFLHPSLYEADSTFLERFEREAHVAALLRSPYTVHLLDYGEEDGVPCIVMEFVAGKSAGALIAEGPLEPLRAARIARDAARALEEARARGVVHRDIKPENILVMPNGMARVADFGIARQEAGDSITLTGGYVGTLAYSAPEQLLGEAEHRSDLFSLGATLYAMLTTRTPFGPGGARAFAAGKSLSVEYAAVPEPLANVIRRCLERDPRDRYQSADDLAGALERAIKLLSEQTTIGSARPHEPSPPAAVPVAAAGPSPPSAAGPPPASPTPTVPPSVPTLPLGGVPPGLDSPPLVETLPGRGRRGQRRVPQRSILILGGVALAAAIVIVIVAWAASRSGSKQANSGVVARSPAHTVTSTAPAFVSGSPSVQASAVAATTPHQAGSATPGPIATSTSAASPPPPALPPTLAPTPPPATALPLPTPIPPTPAPTPTPSQYILSGEWDFNFTVISSNAACNGDPPVGKVITESFFFAEIGRTPVGKIYDGELTQVTLIGGPTVGNIPFHWPRLDFDYPLTGNPNGHATVENTFSDPSTGSATDTETYDDGCVLVMQDNGG